MIIRTIIPEDDIELANIIRQNLAENNLAIPGTAYFDPELNSLSTFYKCSDKREYFVATDEQGRVVGGAGIAEFAASSDCAELQKLYLANSAKGHGLGYKLVELAEEFTKQAGYKKLYLETHHFLTAAIHIYQKMGYSKLTEPLAGSEHSTMDEFYIKVI